MVDEPELLMPHQHVGVFEGAVYIGDKGIEPLRSVKPNFGSTFVTTGSKVMAPGKEVQGKVQALAGLQQIMDLLVAFGTRCCR